MKPFEPRLYEAPKPKFGASNITGYILTAALILGLVAWIWFLIEGGDPYSCPPGTKTVTGISGGYYTHLCIEG
jgi:hypothetical protein